MFQEALNVWKLVESQTLTSCLLRDEIEHAKANQETGYYKAKVTPDCVRPTQWSVGAGLCP